METVPEMFGSMVFDDRDMRARLSQEVYQSLRKTIDEYNAACAAGVDWKYCKDPKNMVPLTEGPFYALGCKMATDGAFGGIKVAADMRALDTGENPIDGLYVTGDAASGRHISLGGLKCQVLNDMSWALSSGFIAGAAAAEYVKKQ